MKKLEKNGSPVNRSEYMFYHTFQRAFVLGPTKWLINNISKSGILGLETEPQHPACTSVLDNYISKMSCHVKEILE